MSKELEAYYNKFCEEKRLTRRHGNVEFITSMKYIHKYLETMPEDAKIRLSAMGKSIYRKGQASYIPLGNIAKRIDGDYIALKL